MSSGTDTEAATTMEELPEQSMKGVYQIIDEEQYK
jgi:hypothetical protein